jgi:hypothetical protein
VLLKANVLFLVQYVVKKLVKLLAPYSILIVNVQLICQHVQSQELEDVKHELYVLHINHQFNVN